MRVYSTRCRTRTSLVIAVRGEIDHQSDLQAPLLATGDETAAPHVVLDLSEVTSIDVNAVSPLFDAFWRITNRGGRFSVVAPDERVRTVLLFFALDWLIPLHATTQAAELDAAAERT